MLFQKTGFDLIVRFFGVIVCMHDHRKTFLFELKKLVVWWLEAVRWSADNDLAFGIAWRFEVEYFLSWNHFPVWRRCGSVVTNRWGEKSDTEWASYCSWINIISWFFQLRSSLIQQIFVFFASQPITFTAKFLVFNLFCALHSSPVR